MAIGFYSVTTPPNLSADDSSALKRDLILERAKYIQSRIATVNENTYKILGIYQALATALVTAGVALLVGFKKWGFEPSAARTLVISLLVLITIIGVFTVTMLIAGIISWVDYRNDEADLMDKFVESGFRKRPRYRSFLSWYETYVVLLVVGSVLVFWVLGFAVVLPVVT